MSGTANSKTKVKIAIVGGGIGGLCLAIGLLAHPQLDVQIFEAAKHFSEIGAGVAVGPNGQRALKLLGPAAEKAFRSQSTGNGGGNFHNDTWFQFRFGDGPHSGGLICTVKNQTGQRTVHRAKFLGELVKFVPNEISNFGKRLTHIEEKDEKGVIIYFADGSQYSADCVIGYDGVHSVVRKHLLGENHPLLKPVFSGSVAYRGLVPMDVAREKLGREIAEVSNNHCGDGGVVMTYPIDFGKTCNIVAIDSTLESWDGPWVQQAEYKKVADFFASWGTPVRKIVELLDNPATMAWSMWESPRAPILHKSRIAICGDAAHATTPFQGQGAGQAIEDALILARLLGSITKVDEISLALEAYEQVRKERSQNVVTTSRDAGELYALRLPSVGRDVQAFRENVERRMSWLWDEDLQLEVDRALEVYEKLRSANGAK